MTDYLTTRELAQLLRIKERKVYDLAASGEVPCSRATGKLLFPRQEIEAWIAAGRTGPKPAALSRPSVVLGSHDPLLEWALRESRAGLATYLDGSTDGLDRFAHHEGVATGIHIRNPASGEWNVPAVVQRFADQPVVLIEWARRQRGLIINPSLTSKPKGIADLPGLRFAARQEESGTQLLLRDLLRASSIDPAELNVTAIARSEADVALLVLEGRADVSFGLMSLATQYRLDFAPVIEERFDLLADRRAWFDPPLQSLIRFCQNKTFEARAAAFTGYDVSGFGRVHFNGA